MLIAAGAQIIDAFRGKGWKSMVLHILTAILYGMAGVMIIINPLIASIVFTLGLGFIILVVGITRIVMAFHIKGMKGWGWPLVSGIISVLLGILIIAQWPISGLWVIGLFVAIEMILSGWSYIFVALAARQARTALPAQELARPRDKKTSRVLKSKILMVQTDEHKSPVSEPEWNLSAG